ncbi:hypothetical protein Q4506_03425 [Colwellia sp. 4_MG-2023]|jgi:hypothetical protein|uniref:hypothetical protein n=1 Tax=unclassified Colwellia TaxID=196834 RepID=UPI0026E23372|nr:MULTISPECIES: hypothetical protein [unclassified Colwellia]MDO6506227.1 hypothetical protein [Colwellia sp. 5_MG-2023]MDO6554713.1 hypothetical protein [Colwellia sp. 4_MG-2023]
MLSTFFKTKPVIDETSKAWIFDTFAWCITELDGEFFTNDSKLVLPNNTFYPGSSSSVEEMANTIFSNTMKYAGMTAWPIKLVSAERFIQKPMPQLLFASRLRGENCHISCKVSSINDTTPTIDIAFHASQLNQPQDLIAYLVQIQASILVHQHNATHYDANNSTNTYAPGGKEVLPQTIDLVACFMGFGVIFANTAYQFKGGCGSCNNRNLNRQSALPELETVYALALFCVIKGIEVKQVKKELKSHLYKHFRQAHKEISLYLQQTDNAEHKQLLLAHDKR